MLNPQQALQGALRPIAPTPAPRHRVLVIGTRSALGWAVLEALLTDGRFERVMALAQDSVTHAIHGFETMLDKDLVAQSLHRDGTSTSAVIVLDRAPSGRRSMEALVHVEPLGLVPMARRLKEAGAQRLVVAMPHDAVLMSAALQQGLASIDEAAVAALGFDQLVITRVADASDSSTSTGRFQVLDRLAHWMLAQLSWLVPRSEQPVMKVTVAKVVAALVAQLPDHGPLTRVLPSAVFWHAAQTKNAQRVVQSWFQGEPLHSDRSHLPWKQRSS